MTRIVEYGLDGKQLFLFQPSKVRIAAWEITTTLRLRIRIRLTELVSLNFQRAIAAQSQSLRRTVSDTNLHSAKC